MINLSANHGSIDPRDRSRPVPDGAVASHPVPAGELCSSALALLDELVDARNSVDLPAPRTDT